MHKSFLKRIVISLIPWHSQNEKIYKLYKKTKKYLIKGRKELSLFYAYKIQKKYGCIISPKAQIGKNLKLPHPIGIVIGEGVKIGDNCIIYQNVTLGRKNKDIAEYPTIGNNVIIYCNSTLVGSIKIGNNAIIGCNSVILKSVEANSTAIGVVK